MNPQKDCPCNPVIRPEDAIVHGDDLAYIMEEVYGKIRTQLSSMQTMTDKRYRIQLTGNLVWIADRFVDIDFEALKNIPNLTDGDHLMVMQDETHDGQTSIYKIYNVESVPNVRYLGYADPNTYPTCAAVEQFVNYQLASVKAQMADIEKKFSDLLSEMESMRAELFDCTEKITAGESKFADVDKKLEDGEAMLNDHADKLAQGEGMITDLTGRISEVETKVETQGNDVIKLTSDMSAVQDDVSGLKSDVAQSASKFTEVDSKLDELSEKTTAGEAEFQKIAGEISQLQDRVTTLENK